MKETDYNFCPVCGSCLYTGASGNKLCPRYGCSWVSSVIVIRDKFNALDAVWVPLDKEDKPL